MVVMTYYINLLNSRYTLWFSYFLLFPNRYLRRGHPYSKEELLDQPVTSSTTGPEDATYENPIFGDDIKVDIGAEVGTDDSKLTTLEEGDQKKNKAPKMNVYEKF